MTNLVSKGGRPVTTGAGTTIEGQRLLTAKLALDAQRTERWGPPPVNVFTELRKSAHLSHDQLALKLGVSKQALIRLEQGTFNQPLPVVVNHYVTNHGLSELALFDDYLSFQQLIRQRHTQLFGPNLDCDPFDDLHVFRQLRLRVNLNLTEVSKCLCIPQATLLYFEKRYKQQQKVPKLLLQVLHDIGYDWESVKQFERDYRLYRDLHGKVTVNVD